MPANSRWDLIRGFKGYTVRMSIKNKCLMICVAKSIIQTFAKFGFFYSSMLRIQIFWDVMLDLLKNGHNDSKEGVPLILKCEGVQDLLHCFAPEDEGTPLPSKLRYSSIDTELRPRRNEF